MSRYILRDAKPYREVVLGWDPSVEAFFLQCFDDGEEAPIVWEPRYELDDLTAVLDWLDIELPDLLRRVLLAEKSGGLIAWQPGDVVYLERARGLGQPCPYRVVEVAEPAEVDDSPTVSIQLDEPGPELVVGTARLSVHPLQIFPALERIGVE